MSEVSPNALFDDDFDEVPIVENGEVILLLARGVGVLVAIVAVLMWWMIMTIIRALLAWFIQLWGVSGVLAIVTVFVIACMKYGNMSAKVIWVMLRHSCS
eukprot:gene402-434_t